MASAAFCWCCLCLQSVILALHLKWDKINHPHGSEHRSSFFKPSFFGARAFLMGCLILKVLVQPKLECVGYFIIPTRQQHNKTKYNYREGL